MGPRGLRVELRAWPSRSWRAVHRCALSTPPGPCKARPGRRRPSGDGSMAGWVWQARPRSVRLAAACEAPSALWQALGVRWRLPRVGQVAPRCRSRRGPKPGTDAKTSGGRALVKPAARRGSTGWTGVVGGQTWPRGPTCLAASVGAEAAARGWRVTGSVCGWRDPLRQPQTLIRPTPVTGILPALRLGKQRRPRQSPAPGVLSARTPTLACAVARFASRDSPTPCARHPAQPRCRSRTRTAPAGRPLRVGVCSGRYRGASR